jgi:CitMHS family citrate-Mg2+:H+ or citrate-Ca2+:H+ symporter
MLGATPGTSETLTDPTTRWCPHRRADNIPRMLTWLGVASVLALLALILCRITSVPVALILVPFAAGLAGGFGTEVGRFAMLGILEVAPTAALLAFAVVYFGVMRDAGLFEPVIRGVLRAVGNDPVRILVGTAVIAGVSHLDGAGASTFMVTVPAMLPIYRRLRLDPVALTAATALAAGTMNMLPWGGPTTRAAAVLQVSPGELFRPLLAAQLVGLAAVLGIAAALGLRERRRLDRGAESDPGGDAVSAAPEPQPEQAGWPRLWLFNAALTLVALGSLVAEVLPLPVVFVVASAVALLANHPDARQQRERLTAHATAAMLMVTTILAAGVFAGVLKESGMLAAMARDLVAALPGPVLAHLPVAMGLASMPLSLAFDPDSFYFGVLPVVAAAAQASGGAALEVGRAALLGQMTTGFPVSPLTPATFLLVGLADVDLVEHQRRTIPLAFGVSATMTLAALLTGALHWG